ncbi:MAG: hypothetical protein AAGC55_33295, partial [Myxococcota bacterium]
QTFTRAVAAMEERMGRAEILRRAARRALSVPAAPSPDVFDSVYDTLREALSTAVAREAAFVSGQCDDNAAADLAERRRQTAAIRAVNRGVPPPTPERIAEVEAEMDELVRRSQEWVRHGADDPAAEIPDQLWVFVVPDSEMAEVLALFQRYQAVPVEDHNRLREWLGLRSQVSRRTDEEAVADEAFVTRGEVSALAGLLSDHELDVFDGDAVLAVYRPAEVHAVRAALDRWEDARGGRGPAIDALSRVAHGGDLSLTARAYGRFRTLVDTAAEGGHGLVWTREYVD